MTDREAFIRQICEEPRDDVRRLVFADWLEENGEDERAAAIRYALWVNRANQGYPEGPIEPAFDNTDWFAIRELLGTARVNTGSDRGFISRAELTSAAFLKHAKKLFRAHPITDVRLTDCTPYEEVAWPNELPPQRWTFPLFEGRVWLMAPHPVIWWHGTEGEARKEQSRVLVNYGRTLANLPSLPTEEPAHAHS